MYSKYPFSAIALMLTMLFISAGAGAKAHLHAPVLLLAGDGSFGNYTAEILRTEGFNVFDMDTLENNLSIARLKQYEIVILTSTPLSEAQQQVLSRFVKEGGNLIAIKPAKNLHALFGISYLNGSIEEGYIAADAENRIGVGITPCLMQFHGEADQCRLTTGHIVASLYSHTANPTLSPAVVVNKYGKGLAIVFLYNLPQSIVYTRQGNYRYAGQEMDGITGLRAMDLFTHGWVDTSKNILNQADEQMRLLSHCIEYMSAYKKPLPRFWYFPDALKCLVTLNNDGEETREPEYTRQFEAVEAKGAKMTLYIKETDFTSKEWVNKWKDKGFEMAAHYDDTREAENPGWNSMDSVYKSLNRKMKEQYGIDSIRTVVNHWFVWCGKNQDGETDFSAQARIEERNGIQLDANYAHYDNGAGERQFLGPMGTRQGNYTGSGLVMKFSDLHGKTINVFQHFNNVYDQQYMEHDDKEGFFNCFKGLVDRSMDREVYSFVSIKAHNAEYFFSEKPLMQMLDYANNKKIPVWTELKLLNFLKARDESAFRNVTWKQDILSFIIESPLWHTNGLTCMLPYSHQGKSVTNVKANGKNLPFLVRNIKGLKYALITVPPGVNYAVAVSYTTRAALK